MSSLLPELEGHDIEDFAEAVAGTSLRPSDIVEFASEFPATTAITSATAVGLYELNRSQGWLDDYTFSEIDIHQFELPMNMGTITTSVTPTIDLIGDLSIQNQFAATYSSSIPHTPFTQTFSIISPVDIGLSDGVDIAFGDPILQYGVSYEVNSDAFWIPLFPFYYQPFPWPHN